MGQYKSIVTCPTCNHESITFDPYSTLSLPIPQSPATEELKTQNFYMFYSNFRYPTKKVALEYNGKTTKDWRSHVAKEMRLEIDELKFFLLTFNDEVFEITHKAGSRQILVDGAIAAARRLTEAEPGLYTMESLLFK